MRNVCIAGFQNYKKMKILFYILLVFTISSCSAVKKIFTKEKNKVEVSEFQQMTSVEVTETETFVDTYTFTDEEIKEFLSGLSFDFSGTENEDSASFEVIKTDTGIRIQVSGKAKSTYTETIAEKTETKEQSEKSTYKLTDKNEKQFEKQTDLQVKVKEKSETKEKFKIDLSIWLYACALVAVLFFIYVYRKLRK